MFQSRPAPQSSALAPDRVIDLAAPSRWTLRDAAAPAQIGRGIVAALALLVASGAESQGAPERSTVAIVGDADRFNIGQDGFCGKRTEIENASSVSFQIPSDKKTWFYIRTKVWTPVGAYTCEADFSFTPAPRLMHIIRYSFGGKECLLEMFKTVPGGTPEPAAFEREQTQLCFAK